MNRGLAFRAARLAGGRQIVLVHGLGVSSTYFVPLLRALAGRADVLAPDLPGFGRTPGPRHALGVEELADALAAFVEAHGLSQPLLVGNSFGCQIAIDVAVRRPELVGGLALIGPTVDAAAPRLAPQTARLLLGAGRERPRLVLQTAVHYVRVGPRRLFATARIVLADPVAGKLPHVHAPAVVIRGEHDLLAPARWCEHLARTLPDAELVTIPGAAHAVHWSHPAETVAALERLPAPRRRGTARSRR